MPAGIHFTTICKPYGRVQTSINVGYQRLGQKPEFRTFQNITTVDMTLDSSWVEYCASHTKVKSSSREVPLIEMIIHQVGSPQKTFQVPSGGWFELREHTPWERTAV